MKQRHVVYTAEAGADLDWIYDTIAEASSPIKASRYEQRIRGFCDRLEHGAERGTHRDDLRHGLRIIGFERRVTIAIVVDDDCTVILRIFYGGRNWEEDFQRTIAVVQNP